MKNAIRKRGRRRTGKTLRFLEPVSTNAEENLRSIVKKAKEECPFDVEWTESDWAVGASFDAQGHFLPTPVVETEGKRKWVKKVSLKFSTILQSADGTANLSDYVELGKAYVTLMQARFGTSRQMLGRHYDVWKALGDCLIGTKSKVREISRSHFDTAEAAMQVFAHATAYARCAGLERLAAFLDDNGLTRTRLSWKTKISPQDPDSVEELVTPHEESVKSTRFAGEEIIKGIGHLYQTIPRENNRDRFLICLIALIVIFGLRSREAVTLPIDGLSRDDDGIWYLNYFRFKRRANEPVGKPTVDESSGEEMVHMGLDRKVVPTVWVELVSDIFQELGALTKEARHIAKKIEQDGFAPNLPVALPETMTYRDVESYFGLGKNTGLDFCQGRDVRATGKRGRQHTISGLELTDALAREVMKVPLLQRGHGRPVYLSDVVGITFPNELRRQSKTRLRYAVIPLEPIVLADFLGGRNHIKSVFEAYSVMDSEGNPLWTLLHALRRFIDDVLDRGGLSELAQAEWFGRKESHNINYQSKTPYQRADELRPHLRDSRFSGKLPDALRRMPVEMHEAYVKARVTTIHVTPLGLCVHEFSQIPCRLHHECDDSCGDLLQDAEAEKADFLRFGIETAKIQVEFLEEAAQKRLYSASRALEYQRKKLVGYSLELARLLGLGKDEESGG